MVKRSVFLLLFLALSIGLVVAAETGGKGKAMDYGKQPWVVDIEELTDKNDNFRTAWWTGKNLQMTVMSVKPKGEIGLEKHDKGDQFIRVEKGEARVVMGISKDKMTFDKKVSDDWAIFIPEGFWHNIINVGDTPLKVYVIYAPPEHPAGTVHKTFEESEAAHGH
jgi:mannose-6-phosphate isomerase-like protein (cupin superfamily)